jgi:hypothetical protein
MAEKPAPFPTWTVTVNGRPHGGPAGLANEPQTEGGPMAEFVVQGLAASA